VNHLDKVPVKYGYDQAFFPMFKEVAKFAPISEYIANSDPSRKCHWWTFGRGTCRREIHMTEVVCEILPEDKPVT
jgi:queuine tRNA-ribosyltransferase